MTVCCVDRLEIFNKQKNNIINCCHVNAATDFELNFFSNTVNI